MDIKSIEDLVNGINLISFHKPVCVCVSTKITCETRQ